MKSHLKSFSGESFFSYFICFFLFWPQAACLIFILMFNLVFSSNIFHLIFFFNLSLVFHFIDASQFARCLYFPIFLNFFLHFFFSLLRFNLNMIQKLVQCFRCCFILLCFKFYFVIESIFRSVFHSISFIFVLYINVLTRFQVTQILYTLCLCVSLSLYVFICHLYSIPVFSCFHFNHFFSPSFTVNFSTFYFAISCILYFIVLCSFLFSFNPFKLFICISYIIFFHNAHFFPWTHFCFLFLFFCCCRFNRIQL